MTDQVQFSLDTVYKLVTIARAVIDFGSPEDAFTMHSLLAAYSPNCVELVNQVLSTFPSDPE